MKSFKYFLLQLKIATRIYIKELLVLAALFVLLALPVFFFAKKDESSQTDSLFEVAVVADDDDRIIDILMSMITDIDGVKNICAMNSMSEKQAFDALEDGSVDLVIAIPEDFYYLASTMQDTRLQIFVRNTPTKLQKKLLAMLSGGERLMGVTEGAINVMYSAIDDYEIPVTKGRMEQDLFGDVIMKYMSKNTLFDIKSLSAYGDYTTLQFYIASVIVAFMVISGVGWLTMYDKSQMQLERLFVSGTVSGLLASIRRILSMCIAQGLAMSFIVVIMRLCLKEKIKISMDYRIFICLWLIAFSTAVWLHFLAVLLENDTHTRVIYILLVLLMISASGVLIPTSYLPDVLRKISTYIPTASYHKLLLSGLWNKRGISSANTIIITDVSLLIVSSLLYLRSLRRHD